MDTFIFQVDECFSKKDSLDELELVENYIAFTKNVGKVVSSPQLKIEIISFLNFTRQKRTKMVLLTLRNIL